jgi:hypothetical protein
MIRGAKKKGLITTQQILKQVTSYDIYRFYFGDFKINEITNNHLRGDKTPSFIIGNKVSHDLTHKDFGDYKWRGDCFNLVQQIHSCDFITALRIIDKDMGLGITDGKFTKSEVVRWAQPIESIIKPPPLIQVATRKPTLEELKYWDNYYLDEHDLKEGNVFFPKEIYRNRKRLPLGDLLTFCYWYPELEIWKIYRPHAPKREKDTPMNQWKWDNGGIPFDYCDGLENIQDCHYGFLGKGRKDSMFLKKVLGICIADTQAEDPACISEETIAHLKVHSVEQVCLFDGDKKGKETSWWLTNNHGFRHCNVPDKYVAEGLTDFPDWGAKDSYGENAVIEHFTNKGFI